MSIEAPQFVLDKFSDEYRKLFSDLYGVSSSFGANLYLVGGAVRDLFVERELRYGSDLDFMIEPFEDSFSKPFEVSSLPSFPEVKSEFVFNEKYLTAKLSLSSKILGQSCIDFSLARKESYETIGARPKVGPGSFYDDMARRDFSINAMAVKIGPGETFSIEDPFEGLAACKKRELRVLHRSSFADDPARIIRGLRFIHRLKLNWNPTTKELVETAVQGEYLSRISTGRLLTELKKAFAELGEFRNLFYDLFDSGVIELVLSDSVDVSRLLSAYELLDRMGSQQIVGLQFCLSDLRFAIFFSEDMFPWEDGSVDVDLSPYFSKEERRRIGVARDFWFRERVECTSS